MTRRLLYISAAALLAACGSDSPTAPATQQTLDVSALISQMSAASVNGIAGARTIMLVPAAIPITVPPISGCTYSATTQGFVCPAITNSELTINLSYFLYDASGHAQSAPNTATTASIRTIIDTKGTLTLPAGEAISGTVAIDDHEDMTMSGLLTTTRTLNGSSKSHFDLNTTGIATLHSTTDLTSATVNVVLPASSTSTTNWPLSGSISSDITSASQIAGLGSATVVMHAVITFNGTSIATITVTLAGITKTCRIDLSGSAAPAC